MERAVPPDPTDLFLYHTRKAGGTSLRHICRSVARTRGLTIEVLEGWSLGQPVPFAFAPRTIHLTSLREPLARLKSAYRFEGRWEQAAETRSPETAVPFAAWAMAHARAGSQTPGRLWQCTSNYYVKAFSGYPRQERRSVGRTDFDEARRTLERFEVVLITERLGEPQTSRYLFHVLQFEDPVPYLVPSPETPSPEERDEDLFDQPTLDWLEEANRWDALLYEFAAQLCASRMDELA